MSRQATERRWRSPRSSGGWALGQWPTILAGLTARQAAASHDTLVAVVVAVNGVVACRATVSHRIPQGTCLLYHAKDRNVNVPLTELQGKRRGTENSLPGEGLLKDGVSLDELENARRGTP